MTEAASRIPIVFLPGLDGTGDLYDRFVKATPRQFEPTVVRYAPDEPKGYEDLISRIEPDLPKQPHVLVGESFSGPLAVEVARRSSLPIAVVLVASFILPPRPRIVRLLPWSLIFRLPAPLSAISFLLTAGDRCLAREVREAISKVKAAVLAKRIRSIMSVDVREALAACECPVLYLQGARDRVVSSRELERVVAVKPSTRHATFNSPHLLLQTVPDAAWAAISSFAEEELPTWPGHDQD